MSKPVVQLRTSDSEASDQASASVIRVEVRASDMDPRVAAIRLALRQRPGGGLAPLDDGHWLPGVPLEIDIGPPGGNVQPVFRGFVSHVRPHLETIEGNAYLELLATDVGGLMGRGDRLRTHDGGTESEFVRNVFGEYDTDAEVHPTSTDYAEARTLLPQRGSDWAFVQDIARRHGLTCFLDLDPSGGTLARVQRRSQLQGDQPDLAIMQPDANLRWFDAQLAALAPLRWEGAALDPFTAEVVLPTRPEAPEQRGDGNLITQLQDSLGNAGAMSTVGALPPLPVSGGTLDDRLRGADELSSWVVEGRGEIDGALYRGLLSPGRPVLVRGVGTRLSGAWYVRTVRTIVADEALTQTFVAMRNNTGKAGDEQFGAKAEERGPQ